MGSPISQVAPSTQPQGKGGFSSSRGQVMPPEFQKYSSQGPESLVTDARAVYRPDDQIKPPMPANGLINMDLPNKNFTPEPIGMPSPGKGGNVTYPGQGGQPKMGQPNMYPNTVGQWDNASIQPQQSRNRGGKGKG